MIILPNRALPRRGECIDEVLFRDRMGQASTGMPQIAISLAAGVVVAFGLPALIGLVVYGGVDAIIPTLLYWPLSVTDSLRFTDCANANSVSHKLTCAYTGLFIGAIFYPLATCACSYLMYRGFFGRGGRFDRNVRRSDRIFGNMQWPQQ